MRDTRRERWVKYINIERNINWPGQLQFLESRQVSHLYDFDPKASCLFSLMCNHGSDAELDQPLR